MPNAMLTPYSSKLFRAAGIALVVCLANVVAGAEIDDELRRGFSRTVRPFLRSYCLDCHGDDPEQTELDLSRFRSIEAVSADHDAWEIVLQRLAAHEMPPEEALQAPSLAERAAVQTWIRALRARDSHRNAGDPGLVPARRLSNAEYNYSIRDLTGVDIRPTKTFPVDPANAAGFDNSGESLTMSPALLNKYLAAARSVADHAVLTPNDLAFAPHPVVTDTDRDKYCVRRIVDFYKQQPTELSKYFFACWQYHDSTLSKTPVSSAVETPALAAIATQNEVSLRYLTLVWELLNDKRPVGPIARIQEMFWQLPHPDDKRAIWSECDKLRDYVVALRQKLSPPVPNLSINGVHRGSQPFVLWKNRQYAAQRQSFHGKALYVEGDIVPTGTPAEFVLPKDELLLARHLLGIERFCEVFPDAFYISERGRDYLRVSRKEQEAGRLLSAGFHSMMGYFRDDRPLCNLILTDEERDTLDRLWQELDYVTAAPARQYSGFLWFERTDSRYMRDPVFDFARAEDKNAASAAMIARLADVYLEKARASGGEGVALGAIQDFFKNINRQIEWVEHSRKRDEPFHRIRLQQFAARAWRRELRADEAEEVDRFYCLLREEDGLTHEEAIRDSIVSILMSPHFLYRVDLSNGDEIRRLSGTEVASRLSYFLWSTIPDAQLLGLHEATGQPDAEIVASHARRMLTDDRVRAFATEFAANWLDVRRFEEHNSVDRGRFPEFTDGLRRAMFEEPIRFFESLVREDRSVLELLEADYVIVNAVLAKHYGIEGIEFAGEEWIQIDGASGFDRGGLLAMSVFLTKNSPGLRTSPVKRGYWVVRRLLGEYIPPPPPNVPDLPADESQLGEMSLPTMLAKHRDNKSCAGCHDRFDSIGLAFEGYGPVGERRQTDLGGRPVQTSVDFPSREKGNGIPGLRRYLREHRQSDFIENLCRKMLSYALGRTLVLSDEPLLAEMQSKLVIDEYRFSSLVESIVTSRQFLFKRGDSPLSKGS